MVWVGCHSMGRDNSHCPTFQAGLGHLQGFRSSHSSSGNSTPTGNHSLCPIPPQPSCRAPSAPGSGFSPFPALTCSHGASPELQLSGQLLSERLVPEAPPRRQPAQGPVHGPGHLHLLGHLCKTHHLLQGNGEKPPGEPGSATRRGAWVGKGKEESSGWDRQLRFGIVQKAPPKIPQGILGMAGVKHLNVAPRSSVRKETFLTVPARSRCNVKRKNKVWRATYPTKS